LRRERRTVEEKGPRVPAYIVTFSDMTTLLLTFFVVLISLAEAQDNKLAGKGRESFVQSLKGFGIGFLFGKSQILDFGNIKSKYYIKNPDKRFEDRSIDAKEEEIRRIFKKLSLSVKSIPSQMTGKRADFAVTDIHFGPGDAALNEAAKRFLTEFSLNLHQAHNSKMAGLYVLGLATDAATAKEQWVLSARRAQAVAEFLQESLGLPWPVYSWGAGPGGYWVEQEGLVSKRSQILIAILQRQ